MKISKTLITIVVAIIIVAIGIAYYLIDSLAPVDNNAATVSFAELKTAGLYSVLDPDFGTCANDGVVDCTSAIQEAIDTAYSHEREAGPNRGVVFFPEGDYLISNTLVGLMDREMARKNAVQLVGSTEGRRPRLILKANTFNDNNNSNDGDEANKKAMIHLWACVSGVNPNTDKKECDPAWNIQRGSMLDQYVNKTNGNGAMSMSMGLRNLELLIKPGNPDSIGVRFAGAQDNIMSNVKVTFESGGFAGIFNFIGTNSVFENIEVEGGKYGLYGNDSRWPSFNNVRLINQTVVAISGARGQMPLSLNGFYIEKQQAPAIADIGINYQPSGSSNSGGAYALSDGIIKFREANNLPAIDNRADRQISLQNVFLEKASVIVKNSNSDSVAGNSGGWAKVELYANVMEDFTSDGQLNKGTSIVNLEKREDNIELITRTGVVVPQVERLLLKHGVNTDRLPSPDYVIKRSKENNPAYVYVAHKGITPLAGNVERGQIPATADIGQDLQNIIDGCQNQEKCFILFGKGVYPLKRTIELKSNTHLMGVSNFLTEFTTNPSWSTTFATDVFRSPDDPNALTTMAFFKSSYTSDPAIATFNMYHWRSGRNSLIYGILSTRSYIDKNPNYSLFKPRAEYLVTGNGGGRWFGNNTSGNGTRDKWFPNFRGIKVIDTSQPLTIYGLDPEDAGYNCLNDLAACTDGDKDTYPPVDPNSMQVEIRRARNVSIRGFKCEDHNSVNIFNSSNFFANGVGGCTDWYFENVDKSLILNIAAKFNASSGNGNKNLYEEKKNNDTLLVKQSESAVAIQTGNLPDFTVWDFDGVISTNTPTPVQSATPIPSHSVTPTPTINPVSTSTPTPRRTSTPTPTVINSRPPITTTTYYTSECGRADSDRDGDFDISDFVTFAEAYQDGNQTCDDGAEDFGLCGGRDVDRNGLLNIADFGGVNGFASRYYPKTSCAL